MKRLVLLTLLCLPCSIFANQPEFNLDQWARETARSSTAPGVAISTTKTRNQHYELNISLPDSYRTNPSKHYPVVYLLDPYWDFNGVQAMMGALVYDQYVPEVILVGIGYAGTNLDYNSLRQIDYTPVAAEYDSNSGDGKAFLAFSEHDVIPKVESELRVDSSFRVLAGSSLGGLFTLYAMFERPTLFQGHIASSPAILWGKRWIMQREIDYFWGDNKELWLDKTNQSLPTRLFMTVGKPETEVNWRYEAEAFDKLLGHRDYSGFAYEFQVLDGFHHGGVKFPTFLWGLSFVFKDYLARQTP